MKKYISILLFACVWILVPVHAMVIPDSTATPEEEQARMECHRTVGVHHLYDHGSFYSGGISALVRSPYVPPSAEPQPYGNMAPWSAKSLMCALLYSDWKRLVPEQSIPVYTPYSDAPLAFWFIYKNTETGEVDSAYAWDIRQAWSLLWFRAGLFADMKYTANTKNMYDRTNFSAPPVGQYGMEAYTESLKEPFRSAPMLQMYVYMGKPLLVARDESGAVQHVYFQQRNIENPMERARLYLGDKWYRP